MGDVLAMAQSSLTQKGNDADVTLSQTQVGNDAEVLSMVSRAGELKLAGNGYFALAKGLEKDGNKVDACDRYYRAKANYTKIRLYTDAHDMPYANQANLSHKQPISADLLFKIRQIRYQGDLNSAISSYQMARLSSDSIVIRKELQRALDFANRAATPPNQPTDFIEKAQVQPVVGKDVDRTKGLFWRGRLKRILGDIDGAEVDLQVCLAKVKGTDSEPPVLKEIQNLQSRKANHTQKEKAIFGGWLLR
jgi:hypothetical protein